MFHTNEAEVHAFLATFFRCWRGGRQATFHLDTRGGQAWAQLGLGLGPPGAPRPGAPPGQHHHPHQHPRHPPGVPGGGEPARPARRRPPCDRRRSAARRAEFLARREAAASDAPTSTPATSENQVQPNFVSLPTSPSSALDTRPPLTAATVALDTRTLPSPTSPSSSPSTS